ncbi:conserved hypothetical protein, partial [Ricinus communis]
MHIGQPFLQRGMEFRRRVAQHLAVARRQHQRAAVQPPFPAALARAFQRKAGHAFGAAQFRPRLAQRLVLRAQAPGQGQRHQQQQRAGAGGAVAQQRAAARRLVQETVETEVRRQHALVAVGLGERAPAFRIAVAQFDQRLLQQLGDALRLEHQVFTAVAFR